MHFDKYELGILGILQDDASVSTSEIADRIGLSQSPCWRRIAALEEAGVIRKRVALLDRKKVGLGTQVFAQVKLSAHGRAHLEDFEHGVADIPEIVECYVLMGSIDFLLRVITSDIEAYEKLFFSKLSKLPGVLEINSAIALSEIKHTTALPLSLVSGRVPG